MANIILKDKNGTDITHMGIDYLCMRTLEGGLVRFNEGDIRVISVDELPSENIKEDAIYKVETTEDESVKIVFYTYANGEWIEYGVGKDPIFENLEITENGTYTPAEGVDGWNEVTVNIESDPVLTELTVTENGVYDEPMIGGELDFSVGSTVTFKDALTLDDIPADYLPAEGEANKQTMFIETSDSIAMVIAAYGGFAIQCYFGTLGTTYDSYLYMDEATAPHMGANFGLTEAGWYLVSESTGKVIPLEEPPTVTINDEATAVGFASVPNIFASPSTPADGWNKVTVNVAGDIIDVDELPTENIEEGKIYRVTKESEESVVVWLVSKQGGEKKVEPFGDFLLAQGGMPDGAQVHYGFIESLDQEPPKPNDETFMNTYIWVLRETGIPYMYFDGGYMDLGTALEADISICKGYIDDPHMAPEWNFAFYSVHTPAESSTTYGIPDEANNKTVFEHNGSEWVECGAGSGSGGGLIEVTELPTENIEEGKIYRVTKEGEPVVWLATTYAKMPFDQFMLASPSVTSVEVYYHVVDTLPDTMEPTNINGFVFHIYILNSTGVGYVSTDGTLANAGTLSAQVMNGGVNDFGWTDDIDSVEVTDLPQQGFYTVRGQSSTTYGIPDEANNKTVFEHTSEGGWVECGAGSGSGGGDIIDVTELPTEGIDEGVCYRVTKSREPLTYLNDNGRLLEFGEWLSSLGFTAQYHIVDTLPETPMGLDEETSTMPVYILNTTGQSYVSIDGSTLNLVATQFDRGEDYGWVNDVSEMTNAGVYALRAGTLLSYGLSTEKNATIYGYNGLSWDELAVKEPLLTSANFTDYAVLSGSADGITLTGITDIDITCMKIPDYVTAIGDSVFRGAISLKSIVIPASVTSIGGSAFAACKNLTFTYTGTKEQWKAITFGMHWRMGIDIVNIICTDGTLAIDGGGHITET